MQRHSTTRALLAAGLGAVVFAGGMVVATPSRAQEESPITKFLRGALSNSPDTNPTPGATAPEQGGAPDPSADANVTDQVSVGDATAPDDGTINWSALNSGPPSFEADAPVTTLRSPRAQSAPPGLDMSRTDKPDGSASMSLKHPLTTPWDAKVWDTKVGADVRLAAPPPTSYQPDRPLPGSVTNDNGAGGAWVSTDAPGVGTIGANVDAAQDKRKLGTTFERSMPLGQDVSMTVHGAYALTDMSGAPAVTGSVPLAAAPAAARVLDSEKVVKFNILPTGTSLGAGVTSTSTDTLTHHKLVAEQDLYGPLHVTGTVTDMGQSDSIKSITAGVKFKW